MFGLSFLYPLFLLGAAAAAVPVVLHLIKRHQAPEVPFSAVRFLKHAPVQHTRRKHLRELILLALRVTALLLLAFAFARPYLLDSTVNAAVPVTIVAVDTSFSMSGSARFERVRALAEQALAGVPAGTAVGLMRFDDSAEVVVEPTNDRRRVQAGIAALTTGYGATSYRAALRAAAAEVGTRSGRVIVVTDLQRTGWETSDESGVPERLAVDVVDVGTGPPNLAVLSLKVEPARTIAVIANSGTAAVTSTAVLEANGQRMGEQPLTVPGNSTVEALFQLALPASGVASVTVVDRTGYGPDDVRFATLDPPRPIRVGIVGSTGRLSADAFYLERALTATEEEAQFRLGATSGASLAKGIHVDGAEPDVIVLLASRGIERAAAGFVRSHLARGGGLLVATGPDFDPAVLSMLARELPIRVVEGGRAAAVTFAPADVRHPLFRPLGPTAGGLGRVRFTRASRLDEAGGQVLSRFTDGTPAVMEYRSGAARIVVFASDLNNRWNDFPLHPPFVPFLHEAVRYLAGNRDEIRHLLVAAVPPGTPRRPGVAQLGLEKRTVAVNVDPRESDAARVTSTEFASAISRLNEVVAERARHNAGDTEAQQSFWRYGLMMMLAALAVEGLLGARLA